MASPQRKISGLGNICLGQMKSGAISSIEMSQYHSDSIRIRSWGRLGTKNGLRNIQEGFVGRIFAAKAPINLNLRVEQVLLVENAGSNFCIIHNYVCQNTVNVDRNFPLRPMHNFLTVFKKCVAHGLKVSSIMQSHADFIEN